MADGRSVGLADEIGLRFSAKTAVGDKYRHGENEHRREVRESA